MVIRNEQLAGVKSSTRNVGKTLAPPSLLGGQNGRKAELSNSIFFWFWRHFSEPGLCSTQADGGDMKCIVFTRRLDLFGSWAFNVCLRRALQPLVSSGFLVTCRKCRYDPSLTDLNESVQRPFTPFKKPSEKRQDAGRVPAPHCHLR